MGQALEHILSEVGRLVNQLEALEEPDDSPMRRALESELASLLGMRDEKIDAFARYLIRLDVRVTDCQLEMAALRGRVKKWEKRRDFLAAIVIGAMERAGWKKMEGSQCTLARIGGRERVKIDSLADIPLDYTAGEIRMVVPGAMINEARAKLPAFAEELSAEFEIDAVVKKLAIRAALQTKEVPGASIEVGPATLRAYIASRVPKIPEMNEDAPQP